MGHNRFLWTGLLLSAFLCSPAFSQHSPSPHRYQFLHKQMGTLFRIVLYSQDSILARQAANEAFRRIDELNTILSDYKEDSELNQLSASAGSGQKVEVSNDLWTVLNKSAEAARWSKGAFDITVGPYSKLWRRSRRQEELPSREALAIARKAAGYQYLHLYPDAKAVELTLPGMQLDLGAIGKGYAVDEAMKMLQKQGITTALVDGGGNIRVSEAPPGQKGWQVEIGSLNEKRAQNQAVEQLALSQAGMASSGDVYQFVEINGKRYSHILNPHTGLGLTHQTMVTVIATDGTTADLLSTTVNVLGLRKGKKLLRKYKASACYVQYPDGKVRKWQSRTWRREKRV
jgi:thiamine biosynthesis lipoprotein